MQRSDPTASMIIEPLDLADDATAAAILDIQRAGYAVEAELIGFDGIPAMRDTKETLRAVCARFLGAHVDGVLVGVLAYEHEGEDVTIDRLVVDPRRFRCGVASALLGEVFSRASCARFVEVATGTRNLPAVRLYERHGFRATLVIEVAAGVTITCFRRDTAACSAPC
jgi:ribosomal protein S18 acetylase RimI-like enzyme